MMLVLWYGTAVMVVFVKADMVVLFTAVVMVLIMAFNETRLICVYFGHCLVEQ